MRNQHAVLLTILLPFIIFAQTAKLNIAVSDLSPRGIQQSGAEIISERLRSELLNTSVFKVMERNDMASILKEQGFQKTGACDEASCLVEVGQLLGVERIVAGSVGKIASMHTISLRMINVATGEIMFTVNEDYQGDLAGVLTTAVGNVARKLAARAGGEIVKAAMTGKNGDLYITSAPSEARVEIDGKKVAGETPLTLKEIAAGERRIVVRKDEYFGSKTVTLAPDDLLKVDIAMEKGKGSLKVFSEPDGAEVRIDGGRAGTSPCKIDDITAGEHQIQIFREGYLPQKSTLAIGIGQIENLSVTLKAAGYVSVLCDNPSARILVNSSETGQGKVEKHPVEAGEMEIAVEASGFEPFKKTITVTQGNHKVVRPELVSVFGALSVNSKPKGAQIYLNEQDVGTTPYGNARLQPGNYMLKVMLDSYEPVRENVSVVKNSSVSKEYELKHTVVYLDSVKTVKARVHKRWQWVRRVALGSLAAGTFGGGLYFNASVKEGFERQQEIQKEYDQIRGIYDVKTFQRYEDRFNTEKSETKNDALNRNILYGVAGVFTAGLVISIPF